MKSTVLPNVLLLALIALLLLSLQVADGARGGRRGGKGKGKSNLKFAQVAEFSLVQGPPTDNRVSQPTGRSMRPSAA